MENTIIINTIVNTIATRLKLDSSATNVLNILALKLLTLVRNYDSSKLTKLKIPKPLVSLLDKFVNNLKYFIVLYAIKFIYSKKDFIHSFNKPKQIESTSNEEPELFEIDISNITKLIDVVHKFISLHPDFFKGDINYRLVQLEDNPEPYRVYNDKLYFNDLLHSVNGYITTAFSKHVNHKNETTYNYDMKLYIKKNVPNDTCYINQLERYIIKQTKMGKVVDLSYYKIMPKNLIMSNFYKESIEQWTDDVKYLEDSYFCEHKDFLFSVMKSKMNGDLSSANGWNNLILHGEAGTGKSSCIYRIATLMKRSIVSVDLSLYLDKKRELYNLFYGQTFQLPSEEKKVNVPENAIIVLEEFDNTIRKLLALEKIHLLKDNLVEADFKNKQNILLNQGREQADEPTVIFSDKDLLSGRAGSKSDKLSINKVTHEIDQAIHSNTVLIKNDTLRIFDLLELFQGVVSPPSRVIIATTNHYEEIVNSMKSLFRPGRLSQLKFNYLSWNLLNDLSMYYFGKSMSIEPIEITIATSQIVEMALKYKLSNDHDGFQNELIDLLSN